MGTKAVTAQERDDIRALMAFYDARGWDWSVALEFLTRKYNGTLEPIVIRTRIGVGYGRPRKEKGES